MQNQTRLSRKAKTKDISLPQYKCLHFVRNVYIFRIGLCPWTVYFLSVAGSTLPSPFLILFFRKILDFMEYKGYFPKFTDFLNNHVQKKSQKLKKASILGLFLFVAIPLPSTGAYTGSVLASVFDIRLKYSFPAILLGNMAAGLIMMLLSHMIIL